MEPARGHGVAWGHWTCRPWAQPALWICGNRKGATQPGRESGVLALTFLSSNPKMSISLSWAAQAQRRERCGQCNSLSHLFLNPFWHLFLFLCFTGGEGCNPWPIIFDSCEEIFLLVWLFKLMCFGGVWGVGWGDKQKKFLWHHVNVVIGNPQQILTTVFNLIV